MPKILKAKQKQQDTSFWTMYYISGDVNEANHQKPNVKHFLSTEVNK